LLTQSIETLGQMSCNRPSVASAKATWFARSTPSRPDGPRADRARHPVPHPQRQQGPGGARHALPSRPRLCTGGRCREALENQPNLSLFQQEAADLLLQGERVIGVRTVTGLEFHARAVVLTAGTFLGGRIHVGLTHSAGGRAATRRPTYCRPGCANCRWRVAASRPARRRASMAAPSTRRPRRAGRRRADTGVLVPGLARRATTAGGVLDHPHQPGHARHHPRGFDRSPMFTGKIEGVGPR